ncbi:1755_t:CDS:2 [Acaulospora morrowiae]|uniref:1755_t:CDS:1 n=1 Tax=Acaulospora morrowiae TaxID=94023 RepID=A0A9N9BNM7_9GLOM|nr:1755_t:CDS:2 [Acaulospora morrowiae]
MQEHNFDLEVMRISRVNNHEQRPFENVDNGTELAGTAAETLDDISDWFY